jgi:Lrp/AsnC family transcriptional regulator, leucine-responsive regulatory protein
LQQTIARKDAPISANFVAELTKIVVFIEKSGDNRRMTLDSFDLAILDIVQLDNQRTHAGIGEAVNLSASSVRRRLAAMRAGGVIIADVAVTDATLRGLMFITTVAFEREDPRIYDAFRAQMQADAAVSQCYSVSGETDFVLIVHAASPAAYEKWGAETLMANPAIRRFSTSIVYSRTKFTSQIVPYDAVTT